jgi:hypothetical protein
MRSVRSNQAFRGCREDSSKADAMNWTDKMSRRDLLISGRLFEGQGEYRGRGVETEDLSGFVSGQAESLAGDLYEFQATWIFDPGTVQWSAVVSYTSLAKAVPTCRVSMTSRNLAGGIQGAVRTRVEELIGALDIPTRPDVRQPRPAKS